MRSGLNSVPLQICASSELQNVTLFGNRVLADVISEGSGDEVILEVGWAPGPKTGVIRTGEDNTVTQREKAAI